MMERLCLSSVCSIVYAQTVLIISITIRIEFTIVSLRNKLRDESDFL
jgi:hypothetical protein